MQINIFLASSEELKLDRTAFGDLVRRLNDIYENRGISIKLFGWEDCDAAYNNRRKQEEYNDKVRESDMFLALFHKKAGKFTIEEFDVAIEKFKKNASPKVYTYCKDLMPGEVESEELKAFKKRLLDELGHYWCRYNNIDSMQLHFVMQLHLVENSQIYDLKVENGNVTLEGQTIARMDNLPFAADNRDYQQMSQELASLPQKIEKARLRLDKYPDDEDLEDDLQQKLNRYNKLKEELGQYQQLLFNTAKHIAQLQGEHISERTRRAMDAFNEGKAHEANIILSEAEADAYRISDEYMQSKVVTEQKQQEAFASIKMLLLKASAVMSDISIQIEDRIAHAEELYAQAEKMAINCDYDKKKYVELLFDYYAFLDKYTLYHKLMDIAQKLTHLCEDIYQGHPILAKAYDGMGCAYLNHGDYDTAIYYFLKEIKIYKELYGLEHPITLRSFNTIGSANGEKGDYPTALKYLLGTLVIWQTKISPEDETAAQLLNNIGNVYSLMNNQDKALDYYLRVLFIYKKISDNDSLEIAGTYNNISNVYQLQEKYNQALDYSCKALAIYIKNLGSKHLNTAGIYNNIGGIYYKMDFNDKALEYYLKALNVREKILGQKHVESLRTCFNIGLVYFDKRNYASSAKWFAKAAVGGIPEAQNSLADMFAQGLGVEMDKVKAAIWYTKAAEQNNAYAQFRLGIMYEIGQGVEQNDLKAIEWYTKSAEQGNTQAQVSLGLMYENGRGVKQNNDEAIYWYTKAAEQGNADAQYLIGKKYILEQTNAEKLNIAIHWLTKASAQEYELAYGLLAGALYLTRNYEEALYWAEKAVKAYPQEVYYTNILASVYQIFNRDVEALELLENCLAALKEENASPQEIQIIEEKIKQLKRK